MNKNYKMGMMLLLGMASVTQVSGQVHLGQGAGTVGSGHIFIGTNAGKSNTANGGYNTYIGERAGKNTAMGASNIFLGLSSGENTPNGVNNILIGSYAGQESKGGDANVVIGPSAGRHMEGALNVMLGREAGYNTTGDANTFVGDKAGIENASGSQNTFIGSSAGGNADMINATAIGASTKVTASNCLVLGNNANVGIGYSAPVYQLQLSKQTAAKAGSSSWAIMSDSRLKKNITSFTDGLDLLKQIRPVWFQYNGKAGIETGDTKFVGIIAQEMQKIAPYMVGTFTHQDSLGNKTEYLDYDANAVTYILINSVKEQQQVIEQKDAELKEVNTQVAALSKRLEQLERIVASSTVKPLTGNAARTEPNANGVVLEQNVPNGFSGSSVIKYFIPASVKEALIDVYSANGVKMDTYPVKERGEGKLTISAENFQNGVFLYDLVTDGKSNGVKKMVVQK